LKRIGSKEDKEVPYKEVAKGYEVREGEYVLLSQGEIDAAAGERTRVIAIEEFVRADKIDPVYPRPRVLPRYAAAIRREPYETLGIRPSAGSGHRARPRNEVVRRVRSTPSAAAHA
jgi:hypothetical protein